MSAGVKLIDAVFGLCESIIGAGDIEGRASSIRVVGELLGEGINRKDYAGASAVRSHAGRPHGNIIRELAVDVEMHFGGYEIDLGKVSRLHGPEVFQRDVRVLEAFTEGQGHSLTNREAAGRSSGGATAFTCFVGAAHCQRTDDRQNDEISQHRKAPLRQAPYSPTRSHVYTGAEAWA